MELLKAYETQGTDAMACLDYFIALANKAVDSTDITDDNLLVLGVILNIVTTEFNVYATMGKETLVNDLSQITLEDYPQLTADQQAALDNANALINSSNPTKEACTNAHMMINDAFYNQSKTFSAFINKGVQVTNLTQDYFSTALTASQQKEFKNTAVYLNKVSAQQQITEKDVCIALYKFLDAEDNISANAITSADLKNAINKAKEYDNDSKVFTQESFVSLQTAIADAEKVFGSGASVNEDYYSSIYSLLYSVVALQVDTENTLYGDVNLDGKVTLKDVSLLQGYISEKTDLTAAQKTLGDVDGDGIHTLRDCYLLQQFVSEKIEHFPVQDFYILFS